MALYIRTGKTRVIGVALVATVVAGAVLIGGPANAMADRHPSGIVILAERPAVQAPLPDALSDALGRAARLSEKNSSDLAYPWVDRVTNELVIGSVSARGAALAATSDLGGLSTDRRRSPTVARSRATLETIARQEIGVAVDGHIVSAISPDPEHNRLIAEVTGYSDAMLHGLARRHGPDAIAVLKVERPLTYPGTRQADTSQFYGGAKITNCTAGFAWISGSADMMLTAGHCAPNGGSFSTPAQFMGTVTATTEENWNSGVGTVLIPGQGTFHGDVAVIRITSGRGSYPLMWVGPAISSSNRPVRQMWSRSPQNGDQFCSGGAVKGEQCGWVTRYFYAGWYYYSGTNETAERVWWATKRGHCMAPGDSGGPIYTVRSDGGVAAKGIYSGAVGPGGSDYYAGALEPECEAVYTDIWDAYWAMPGSLQTV